MRKQILAALLAATVAVFPSVSGVAAAPNSPALSGSQAWAVVLCQFSDTVGTQPHTVQWYQDFLTHSAPSHDGLWDYWHDISYGKIDLNGSQVITKSDGSWNTLPNTLAYYAGLGGSSRVTEWRDCANSASGVDYTRFYGVIAMLNVKRESGAVLTGPLQATLNGKSGSWGAVVLDPAGAQDVSWGAHEMGHGFGLNHNFDTALKTCVTPATKSAGEYCDPYDQMGYENGGNDIQTSQFSYGAPGMTAPNLIKLGFVSPHVDDPSKGSQDVPLAALETAPDVIEVPAGDSPQHYYTIEYRDPSKAYASGTAWGKNQTGGVIIHEARTNGLFYLVDTQSGPSFGLCQSFLGVNNIRILVLSLPGTYTGSDAYVRVGKTTDGVPDPGYCNTGLGGVITGPGGGGGPTNGCASNPFGVCYPKLPICPPRPSGQACQPNPGRMQ